MLASVLYMRRRRLQTVRRPTILVRSDLRLVPEAPLVSLLCLVRFRASLPISDLRPCRLEITPESDATDLHGSDKGTRILGIASSHAAPPFEVKESTFHQVTQLIKVPVMDALFFTVLHWRNDSLYAETLCHSSDLIGIIPAFRKQILGIKAFNQLCCS